VSRPWRYHIHDIASLPYFCSTLDDGDKLWNKRIMFVPSAVEAVASCLVGLLPVPQKLANELLGEDGDWIGDLVRVVPVARRASAGLATGAALAGPGLRPSGGQRSRGCHS